jgi:hypothetical protein
MAIVRKVGKADAFITLTANPGWDEVKKMLEPGQTAQDRPDVVTRVFQLKLQQLLKDLLVSTLFGSFSSHLCSFGMHNSWVAGWQA